MGQLWFKYDSGDGLVPNRRGDRPLAELIMTNSYASSYLNSQHWTPVLVLNVSIEVLGVNKILFKGWLLLSSFNNYFSVEIGLEGFKPIADIHIITLSKMWYSTVWLNAIINISVNKAMVKASNP